MESARIVFWHSSTCCGFCCLLCTSHGITDSNILSVLVHRSVLVWCFWNTSQSRWWFTKKRFYCGGWFSKRSVVVAFFLEILHKVLRVNYWKWHNYSDILRNLQYVAVNLAFMVCTIFETVDLINYIGTFIWVQESQCVNHHSSSRLCVGGSVSSPCRQSREHHWEPGMSIGCEELPPFLWVPHFLLTWGLVGVLGCFVGFFCHTTGLNPPCFCGPCGSCGALGLLSHLWAGTHALCLPSEHDRFGDCILHLWDAGLCVLRVSDVLPFMSCKISGIRALIDTRTNGRLTILWYNKNLAVRQENTILWTLL